MKILIVAEYLRGGVRDLTHELVSAATELGGDITIAAIADEPSAEELSIARVDQIIRVQVPLPAFEADVYASALAELIGARKFDLILLPFTVTSMSYAPAVAARLDLGYGSDVFELGTSEGRLVAVRAFYGGKVHGEIEFPQGKPTMLLLRPGRWPAATGAGTPTVSDFTPTDIPRRARHVAFSEAPPADVDITKADFILAIGRGIGQQTEIDRFERLAERIGATLAVSRPLVDAGWIGNARQVGQSGQLVKPRIYLALGISGAVQHVAGMKDSQTVIAVNKDPEAAIFSIAHFAAVADLFEVAEGLEAIFA